jgi:cell division protease FtsH
MVFLGREISEQRNYSEKVAEEIDEEVRHIIDRAYHTAKQVLTDHRDKLEEVVQRILEEETIEGEDLNALLSAPVGQAPPPKKPEPPTGTPETEEPAAADEAEAKPHPGSGGLAYGPQATIHLDPDS